MDAFDSLYLWDGLPLCPLALGLSPYRNLRWLLLQSINVKAGEKQDARFGQIDGIKDTLLNWFLVIRCSSIAVPRRGTGNRGLRHRLDRLWTWRVPKRELPRRSKGDVRGHRLGTPNNAKEGGAWCPPLRSACRFCVDGAYPGGVSIHGLVPGPEMLTKNLDVTYTLVWSVALPTFSAPAFASHSLTSLPGCVDRIGILAPVVLAVTYVGAFRDRASGAIFMHC